MKETGGYFELELEQGGYHYHDTLYVLKSGRAALSLMLGHIQPALVYVPFYTCDSLLEPFKAANINYAFYAIDETLSPATLPELKQGEYFLYINYFGLKENIVEQLSHKYGDKLIVDCTQAFFMKGTGRSWYFNSCRKFFGVPDGSYMYAPAGVAVPMPEMRNELYITDHLLKRFNGHTNDGYALFVENELLAGKGVSRISKLSEYMLSTVNYDQVIEKRLANYRYLHERLKSINLLDTTPGNDCVPMSYPLLLANGINKQALAAEKLFIPSLWKDTLYRGVSGFDFEKSLADKLCPLPVDHRYTTADMEAICKALGA